MSDLDREIITALVSGESEREVCLSSMGPGPRGAR
jgi:hypothetical protein